jgi:hypothetical protein
MALQLKLGTLFEGNYVADFSEDGTKITIADSTGNYDAGTNTGGYGTPNPDRADVGLVIVANYKGSAGDTPLVITAYDPETATELEVALDLDGWIRIDGWLIDNIVGGEAIGAVGYNTATNKVYVNQISGWYEITDLNDLLLYSGLVTDTLHVPNLVKSSKKQNDVNNERFDKIITGDYNESRPTLDDQYSNISGRIQQGSFQFSAGNYSEFQRIVEALTKYIAQYGI